ncbi:MAG: ATP-dependent zinc metalloprotease FtsH [Candidatus Gracilibacteria bacterium]|nr:ATP-dependent zinc metalloprotease FtsH [Candidatus Gracilibacteria bacterium]
MPPKKEKSPKKIKTPELKTNNLKAFVWLIIISLLIAYFVPILYKGNIYLDNNVSLDTFTKSYNSGVYSDVLVDGNKAIATLSGKIIENNIEKEQRDIVILPENDSLKDLGLLNTGSGITTKVEVKDLTSKKFWEDILPSIVLFILFAVIAFLIIGRMGGVANNAMSFGKSRARIYDKNKDKILFTDVAGAEEEKVELMEIVDFLKNPKKYKEIGAKIPKGILLVGPPGTGKTLIARAVAGESDVPFLSISGSEFVEMFVGVGASRVRDLFEQAKKLAPSIIFIDEIDAIGKKRGPGLGGGHDEREQTLNQILTEMDGFDQDTNVIIMGATNRADVLDKALLRPGRFDRKVTINLPNLEDREKILLVHSKGKPISKKIDFKALASKTVGFSGADLGNLINEAAIITARKNLKEITDEIITEAFERIVMGLTKKSQVMDEQEKKTTAYHEVGHALVGKLLPNTDPVHKVSIISRGGALGVTWFLPERDRLLVSKAKYLDELATLYGGRVAEEIFFGRENITTGASNDIERATKIARDMITRFGMDEEIGAENFAPEYISGNYLGAEGQAKPFGEKTQDLIDAKVKEILANAYKKAKELITNNKDLHIKIAEDLIIKEEINKEEFEAYFA